MINRFHICLAAFFVAFLAAGIFCISHTGISWDEPAMREYGRVLHAYISGESTELLTHHERFHGPFFELVLIEIENALDLTETREIYNMRHIVTFLANVLGLFFFFLLGKRLLKNQWLSLLAVVLLASSPRIFSNLIYNSKDTVFMMAFIASIWSLHVGYEKRSTKWMLLHGVLVAIAITVRILGILLPAISMFALLFMPAAFSKKAKMGGVYLFTVVAFVITFWPVLWPSPFPQLKAAFEFMSQFPWDDFSLFEGQFLTPKQMPWYYLPKWIIMTTPLLQVVLGLIGPLAWIIYRKNSTFKWVVAIWAIAPLLAIIVLSATVYDTWRHVYFIYPAWIIMGVEGLRQVYNRIQNPSIRKTGIALLVLIIGSNLAWSTVNHRNLQCYFNPLFRTDAALNYEYDFWGLAYLESLQWIVAENPEGTIHLSVANAPGYYNHLMLDKKDIDRIEFVSRDSADYFLSNFRFPPDFELYRAEKHPYQNLVFEVNVDGNRALGVYQPNR